MNRTAHKPAFLRRAPGALSSFLNASLFVLASIAATNAWCEDLRGEVLSLLRGATFEVVLEKPTNDSLSYEKPLPFDLLPYRVRNDKYDSIGTAFALEGGRFVSAAHVVSLGSESVRRRIHLRASDGRVIDLDRIVKFSASRDFVVFTVKNYRAPAQLQVNTASAKNDKVFAVGNALGDGVIARDGLYTSDTPEEENGRWKWMRFSAAASPGNSGGPLVDRDGKVIGVVLRKSQNENLNFALPIEEAINASASKADIKLKAIFKLQITDGTLQGKLDETIDLPAGYMEFGRKLQALHNGFTLSLSEEFKRTNRNDLFPAAQGAQGLLYQANISTNFPQLITKQRDGTWYPVSPKDMRKAEIGKNGYLSFGAMGSFLCLRLQAPDDISIKQLQTDSKLFMDLLLRGLYFNRSFGSERVRITSMGPARKESAYVDAYQRKWQVRRWTIEHSDETVVAYALPMPGGYAILLNAADEAASFMYEVDMKTLTDFVYITYYGTLRQWQDFLAVKEMLPAAFASISIQADYGKEFRYRSPRFALAYPHKLMKVAEDSDLHVKFSYFKENDRVVWDASSILAGESKDTTVGVSVSRHLRPPEILPDSDRRTWESMVHGRMPYTGAPFFEKSSTIIGRAYAPGNGAAVLTTSPVLYSVVYAADGNQDTPSMAQRLAGFRTGITIKE